MTSIHHILTPVKRLILILIAGGESKARNTWKTKAQQLESYPFHTEGITRVYRYGAGMNRGGQAALKRLDLEDQPEIFPQYERRRILGHTQDCPVFQIPGPAQHFGMKGF